jgi:hypothetical protein
MSAETFCLVSAAAFFLAGLLTGAWKYRCILAAADGRAPPYVDVSHRASLLYAFACALLAELARRSAWPNPVNLAAAIVLVIFFAATVLGYVVHGALRDTDNQLRRPHRLGARTVPPHVVKGFMAALVTAELASFLVLFSGLVTALR